MTEKRTIACHGCGWRYSGTLANSKESDHSPNCPVFLRMQEVKAGKR